MSLAVVQHSLAIHPHELPGQITLGSAPTAGNLLIAALGVNENSYTVGTGWTQADVCFQDEHSNSYVMIILYRYVQGGDTATLPAFMSAGVTYWTHSVYEISGVSGTWSTDFAQGVQLQSTISNNAIPQLMANVNGSMGLFFSASYNGSSNPSISGSWTMDDTANNNTNYGSASGSHRALNDGDKLDGTLSQGTSGPFGAYVMILQPSKPTNRVYPQHGFVFSSNGGPSGFTVPWTPIVGNLLIAVLGWKDGSAASPTINSNWTEFESAAGGTGKAIIGMYRYVQSGDTASLPGLVSSGTTFFEYSVLEFAGVSGTFANDVVLHESAWQASGATQATSSQTTTAAHQLAVLFGLNYDGTTYITTTGFEGYLHTDFNNGDYGSWFAAVKNIASSSTAVSGTITESNTGHAGSYLQLIMQGGSGSGGTTTNKTVAATNTPAPAIARQTSKKVAVDTTPVASISTLHITPPSQTSFFMVSS